MKIHVASMLPQDMLAGDEIWDPLYGGWKTLTAKQIQYMQDNYSAMMWMTRREESPDITITQPMHVLPRRIPDWPLRCPKCQSPDSAVLLFQTWDCKHGCFKSSP